MFAKEGYALIAGSLLIGAGVIFGAEQLPVMIGLPLKVLGIIIPAFTMYFFRDPQRTPPTESEDGSLLLSPADGKVLFVRDIEDEIYLNGPATQISIFLSPLNVHVNRIPAAGTVEYAEYIPGKYLVAWHEKSSELNERSQIGVKHPSGRKILFKQIAGFIARRIVFHCEVGDTVSAGERFGIVKFGSRMDIIVPRDVEISVKEGDKVAGGTSILGSFPNWPAQKETTATTAAIN